MKNKVVLFFVVFGMIGVSSCGLFKGKKQKCPAYGTIQQQPKDGAIHASIDAVPFN
jgi:hypothetical protein